MRSARRFSVIAVMAGAAVLPAGCGSEARSAGGSETSAPIQVVASFYPLQFVVERIGGDRVTVQNLTPQGAEPHELELSAENAADLEDADLIVYLSGFSPAVDDGIDAVGQHTALDVADAARLDLRYTPIEAGRATEKSGVRDPHFWLDPSRLEDVTTAVAERLGALDPGHATAFIANAAALIDDLRALDGDFRTGLATCTSSVIVTSHNAFGYLAEHYGMTQIGITGLTPEDEPLPRDLAAVTAFVEDHHVRTIYYEALVSPAIADTVASETGAATMVLDPIEGLSDTSRGTDYLTIMRANLTNLRAGQGCT